MSEPVKCLECNGIGSAQNLERKLPLSNAVPMLSGYSDHGRECPRCGGKGVTTYEKQQRALDWQLFLCLAVIILGLLALFLIEKTF